MTKLQFENEKRYRISVSIVKNMLDNNIISEKEYHTIDTILKQKYQPILANVLKH